MKGKKEERKMKGKKLIAITALVALGLAALSGVSLAKTDYLTLQGSTTVLPIAQVAAEEFMDLGDLGLLPRINISVRGGGSGVGIAALIDGSIDIADASRPIKDKEIENAEKKGIEPYGTVIAKDGIAVVVHPSNSIEELTLEQIRKIYTGNISDWSEVGGKAGPIVIVSRDTTSGTFETFKELVLEGEKVRDDALMVASNQAVATTVATTPGAIGYVGLGYLSDAIKALVIDGVKPSQQTVVSGEYKLSRPLYMYTDGKPTGAARDFINFVLSLAGQRIVEDVGFVPLR